MSKTHARVLLTLLLLPTISQASDLCSSGQSEAVMYMASRNLTPEGAQKLEEGLVAKPDDLDSRILLIAYYFRARIRAEGDGGEFEKKRVPHVFWLIENCPDVQVAGSPEAGIDLAGRNPEDYLRGKQLWLQQVEKYPANARVLRNAAQYFSLWDKQLGRQLLEKALLLNPSDIETISMLARSYMLERIRVPTSEESSQLAKKALALWEQALVGLRSEYRQFLLEEAAVAAFEAGEIPKAQQYATELLEGATGKSKSWHYGNAIHKGNIILGRVALRFDDIPAAIRHLHAAGETPGSPQLNSFGPNMSLAQELLEKGETQAVLAYLQACGKFWKSRGEELQSWIATVQSGGKPNFGSNLHY